MAPTDSLPASHSDACELRAEGERPAPALILTITTAGGVPTLIPPRKTLLKLAPIPALPPGPRWTSFIERAHWQYERSCGRNPSEDRLAASQSPGRNRLLAVPLWTSGGVAGRLDKATRTGLDAVGYDIALTYSVSVAAAPISSHGSPVPGTGGHLRARVPLSPSQQVSVPRVENRRMGGPATRQSFCRSGHGTLLLAQNTIHLGPAGRARTLRCLPPVWPDRPRDRQIATSAALDAIALV